MKWRVNSVGDCSNCGAARQSASHLWLKNENFGAESRDRTGDLTITNRLLYQLSYLGSVVLATT